jgi:hypothetical protein
MAIYGIGAYYDHDVSQDFIARGLAGVGWPYREAPELHRFIESLKVGDIIYIKAAPLANADIVVRAVGFVKDGVLLDSRSSKGLVQAGRNVLWRVTKEFRVPKPRERNNVRTNTPYEEHHPDVQAQIMARLCPKRR